jgi:protein disulfide-isomerase
MNKLVIFLMLLMIGTSAAVQAESPASPTAITWLDSYETAITQSKETTKPVILFFTGSDWCTWCKQLEKEVFETQDFAKSSGSHFIFVKLDFPLNRSLPLNITSQNKELQRKYDVRRFPTVVIIDSQQKQIGITGYRPGGGKSYGAHLDKIVSDYTSYQDRIQAIEKKKLSSEELKELYSKAKELGRLTEALQIVNLGILSQDNQYFMIEKYRFLADEGQIFDEDTIQLRKAILDSDPSNASYAHYQVAVIDFEAACEEMEKENFSPEITVAPLVSYIEKFGKQDPDHLWKLEMIISQVYFEKGKLAEALKYAQASLSSAPEPSKAEIGLAIKNIQSQLETY